jgi:hypothetical protein
MSYEFEDRMLEKYLDLPGMEILLTCPADHSNPPKVHGGYLADMIIHLNDDLEWSREAIADWLDSLIDKEGIDLSFKEKDATTQDSSRIETIRSEPQGF